MVEPGPPTRVRRFTLGLRALFAEFRRRRVFRVLAAYVVVGFTVAEGADIFFPSLGLPDWTVGFVAVLVILGLPVALGLAWAFDVVPDQSTEPQPGAARWARVQEVFENAVELPDEAVEAFLSGIASGEPDVAAEVRSLLVAHREAGPLDDLHGRVTASVTGVSTSAEGLEGQTVLQYEVLERLGGGGMGVVYKAKDARLGRVVTLKFLSTHLLTSEEAKQRFLIEAQAAGALDHPNLCTIHEIGETEDGLLFIAMAFYSGDSLRRRIDSGLMPVEEALSIAAQMCRGLAFAAQNDVVHRDIKPANVMLTSDGVVKIVDFGLAKRSDGSITRTGTRMGTISYMSPEQTQGEVVDQRTDVWSVGVVLYEMLTGKRPFKGGSDQAIIHSILNTVPTPASDLTEGLSPGVVATLDRALQKEPARRYPDASAMLADLEQLIADPESFSRAVVPSLPVEGERRLMTALACTITGFGTLLESLEPDAVDQRLATLRARLQRTVEDYGGVLNDFSEDRAIALFGVPVAHEDDTLRAVRAALEIRKGGRSGDAVGIRSALLSSQVAIRPTDEPERPYRLGGSLARDAARLAARGEQGDILIAGELARAVMPFVETEPRAGIEFEVASGTYEPVAVLGETEVDSRLDASSPGTLTRFVGRSGELASLVHSLESTNTGGGRLVSIVGDAGVGKSRLLHEFRRQLADDGVRYVQGRCQVHGSLTPFVPFIECVKAMLGLSRVPQAQLGDQVISRTLGLSSELGIYAPLILHLLSIESERHPVPDYLVGDDLRAALAEALVSVFTLGSRGQPLVLLLEDWHWADSGSDDVLALLTEMISAYPLLVVVTSRPATDEDRVPPAGQLHLDLAPLEPESAVAVMQAIIGARLPVDLAARITEKTGGNPFFIEELCRTLVEEGTIAAAGGEAFVKGSLDRLTIPDTVQAVLKTRLDRLDPEAREVLRSASVIGRAFGHALLARVVPSASRLPTALDALRASGLIQRTGLVPEATYRFKHALTLDVTYDSLLERQRRERNLLVGEALEELHADDLDAHAARLARHFGAAESWDRAVTYGRLAAQRAAALWRLDEAVSTLERTRAWVVHLDAPQELRDQMLVELLLAEERHLETLGRRERQQAAIDELLRLLPEGAGVQRAIVLVRQGELATLLGDYEGARVALDEAITIAETLGAETERIMAVRAIGHQCWRAGSYEEAISSLTEVVEHDRAEEASTRLPRDLVNLGRVLRELGRWDEALAIGHEALAMANDLGDPLDQIYASNYFGHLYRAMGRPEDALASFERARIGSTEINLPVRLTFNLLAIAALQMDLGRIEESWETYEEAVETARRTGRADSLAAGLSFYGDALMAVGQPEAAIPRYEEAATILRPLGVDQALARATGNLARAREQAGHDSAADSWAETRLLREHLGDQQGVLEAVEHEARLRLSDPDRLSALHDVALTLATDLGDVEAEARIRNSLAITAWKRGELDEAAREYATAAARLRLTEERPGLGAVLNGRGAVLTHLGRYDEAQAVLDEAREINEAAGDLERGADSFAALGALAREQNDVTRAFDLYESCLEHRRLSGDRVGEGWALHRLAEISTLAGAPDRAATFSATARAIARETRHSPLERACAKLASPDDASSST
ncbi:MAG: tetratricopeptide repeat protein [Gemmatimonadetes bacterium]|nr:tetratricopeptide repeat protein [Gemmatimonadota bacterium]NNF38178.1 tetratricopeptide repeat protein [Gemmatimonadota bacterium]